MAGKSERDTNDSLHEQLQKEEKVEANSAVVEKTKKLTSKNSVVVEPTKKQTTKPTTASKPKKRGLPKLKEPASKKSDDRKKADSVKPQIEIKPPTTKKKGSKPAAKKVKGLGKPRISADTKKGDKVNVTKKTGDKANVTKKASTSKAEEKSKSNVVTAKPLTTKSTDSKKTQRDNEKKKKRAVAPASSKPKGGKSEKKKQQLKKPAGNSKVGKKSPKTSLKNSNSAKIEAVKKKGEVKTSGKVAVVKPADATKRGQSKTGKKIEKSKTGKRFKSTQVKKPIKGELKVPAKKASVMKNVEKPKTAKKKAEKKKNDSTKGEKVKINAPKKGQKAKTDLKKKKGNKNKSDSIKKKVTNAGLNKKLEKIKDQLKGEKAVFKKDKKRPSGNDPPVSLTPAKKKRKQKPPKKKVLQIRHGVFLASDLSKASNLPIPERTEECDMSKFDIFDSGMVFFCNSSTEKECLENKLFGSPKIHFERMEKITEKTAVFLYNVDRDSPALQGVWLADGKPKMNLDKDMWDGRFPAQVRVKEFHRFSVALPGKVLKNVFQTKRLFQSCSLLTQKETHTLFEELNKHNTRVNLGPLAVPLLGKENNVQPVEIEPTVKKQMEMLYEPVDPNPRKTRKWCLTQVESDPLMFPHPVQDNPWRQRWFSYDSRQQMNFWNWGGGLSGWRGYPRGPNYRRGGYRSNRRNRGGRRKNFTPGAVRQEDIEKLLRSKGSVVESVKKKKNMEDVKKNLEDLKKEGSGEKKNSEGVQMEGRKSQKAVKKNFTNKDKGNLLTEPDSQTSCVKHDDSRSKDVEMKTTKSSNTAQKEEEKVSPKRVEKDPEEEQGSSEKVSDKDPMASGPTEKEALVTEEQ